MQMYGVPGGCCGLMHGGGLHEKPDVPWAAACKTSLM